MLVLGIESSCDETSAGVVDLDGPAVRSNVVASQHAVHGPFGGVVPELAAREHLLRLEPVVAEALRAAGVTAADLGGVAVTRGPGLAGCLQTGLAAAKAFAWGRGLPWVGVNHIEAHVLAAFLERPSLRFPFVALVVSGGHTALLDVEAPDRRVRLDATLDDAAGEAFDKVAKLLGLGYPGGPALDALAEAAGPADGPSFPRARPKDGGGGFSYSGLKTAVRVHLERERAAGRSPDAASVAAAFRRAAVAPLAERAVAEAQALGRTCVVAGGGVAANRLLRAELTRACAAAGLDLVLCRNELCGDNGAMVAYAGGLRLLRGETSPWDLGVDPQLGECA